MPQTKDIQVRAGSTRGRSARRSGFTLLEILIAVAALGLIAVGVASIFDATGKTLAAGKRVSSFNAYASLIEQQLRSDISSMTREGFLVIRNEYASAQGASNVNVLPLVNNPDGIPLYDGDENKRLRRIDEFMFFSKGQFVSARTALDPAFLAKSDAARIYYGHGQRARPPLTFNQTDPYYQPELNGLISNNQPYDAKARLGYYNASDDPPNPNRFASDWILLRQVTLLAPPRTSQISAPTANGVPTGNNAYDSSIQISLQPAASDIFRGVLSFFPVNPGPASLRAGKRAFNSGLVDIAATDLSKIRSIVCTARVNPNAVGAGFFDPAQNVNATEQNNAGPDGQFRLWGTGAQDPQVIFFAQQWMDDAFPANSMAANPAQIYRVRCEPSPRNFVGALDPAQWSTPLEAAYRAADQVMLSASNFLPRCTEFIVEWSFGKTYPSASGAQGYVLGLEGQTIWHGMERKLGTKTLTSYYKCDGATVDFMAKQVPWTNFAGSNGAPIHLVPTRLIHGEKAQSTAPLPGDPLTSYFGFYDPTFNPDKNNDGRLEDVADSVSPTIPWAWPKLIRVTLSLADPADPTVERTYQFVFDVPGGA